MRVLRGQSVYIRVVSVTFCHVNDQVADGPAILLNTIRDASGGGGGGGGGGGSSTSRRPVCLFAGVVVVLVVVVAVVSLWQSTKRVCEHACVGLGKSRMVGLSGPY